LKTDHSIFDNNDFIENKRYLESELKEIHSGKAQFIGFEELDARLENVLKKIEQKDLKDKNPKND
jgi:hypothetical protein